MDRRDYIAQIQEQIVEAEKPQEEQEQEKETLDIPELHGEEVEKVDTTPISAAYIKISDFFDRFKNFAKNKGYQANRFFGGIPTPGSITLPLGIFLFLFLVFVRVKGKSRIQWVWNVLFGFATLNRDTSDPGKITQVPNAVTTNAANLEDSTVLLNDAISNVSYLTFGMNEAF